MTIVNLTAVADTYTTDTAPNAAAPQGSSVAKLKLGYDARGGSGGWYSWMRFDLSSIPAGSTINSAKLEMYLYFVDSNPNYSQYHFDACRSLNTTWPETITFNTEPTYQAPTNAYSTIAPELTANAASPAQWTLTADVAAALASGAVCWTIRPTDIGEFSDYVLLSFQDADYTVGPPPTIRPRLVVDYTAPIVVVSGIFRPIFRPRRRG